MRKSSIKIKSRAIGTKPIREITTKMKKKRILGFGIYLNEAVMENEAQQLSRDILLVGVNLRHRRPHNGLNFWASLAVEIVFKIRLTLHHHLLHEEILAAIGRSQRNQIDQWFLSEGGG
ncbi:hypothetical protein FF1_019219 [Malus domestica]